MPISLKKRFADAAMLSLIPAFILLVRAFLWIFERVGPQRRRPGARVLRELLRQMDRERRDMERRFKDGGSREGLAALEAFVRCYGDTEVRPDLEEMHDRLRAVRDESDALHRIRDE